MNENRVVIEEEIVQLLRYLIRMGKVTEVRMDTLLNEIDLSASRLLTLRRLEQAEEPLSLSQLASCLAFVKSNATQLIDRLEQDQLVRRVPHAEDRRCTLIEVTEAGKQRHQDAVEAIQPLVDKFDQLYTPEERAQLLSLLQRLETSLS
jgi:DNA-binding MarR family transcriptional regulator